MDALDLKLICASDTVLAKYFRGVFSRDNLPSKVVKYPSAFIVNTDISTGPGQHWVAVFFNEQKRCFYFDSYGGRPMNELANFTLDNSVSDVFYNTRWFQGPATATCGLYVTHFLYHAARGMLSGQHWVAVFFNEQKRCFYFDSYGGRPMNELANFTLDNSVSDVFYNTRWFQGPATATCGLYVTHFLYHAARGMLLEAITGWPFEHLAWLRNEARIKKWARRMIAHSSGSI